MELDNDSESAIREQVDVLIRNILAISGIEIDTAFRLGKRSRRSDSVRPILIKFIKFRDC